jgi:hypothetical protein
MERLNMGKAQTRAVMSWRRRCNCKFLMTACTWHSMRYQTAELIGYNYVRDSRGDPVPIEYVPDHRLAGFVRGLEKHVAQALLSDIAADWVPELFRIARVCVKELKWRGWRDVDLSPSALTSESFLTDVEKN